MNYNRRMGVLIDDNNYILDIINKYKNNTKDIDITDEDKINIENMNNLYKIEDNDKFNDNIDNIINNDKKE